LSVQVWVGEIPEHSQEREAIVALARGLGRLDELYLVLANFTVGGQAVDLAIFKHNGGFVIELKHCDGRVIGGVNGKWQVLGANGEVHVINPDRRNPYNQVISYFYRLSNFLNQRRSEFLSEHRAAAVDFRTCKRLVVIAPSVHPESEIVLDWKVDLKGLDQLPTYLVTTTSSEIELSEEELLAIPGLLRCEPWRDVNLLVSEDGGAGLLEALPVAAAEEMPAGAAAAETVRRRWPLWLILVLGGALVLGLAAGLGFGLGPVLWSNPSPTSAPTETPIVIPTFVIPTQRAPASLVAWVEQPVTRESAYAGGLVTVTLRTVEFQSDRMTLTWAMENCGTRPVRFPLTSDNITIHDNVGNNYQLDEKLSQPRILVARPDERVEGTCTVSRPVSPDAITIIVWIRAEPFEGRDPAWPVNIPGRE
jgi:hypothetical protein